MYVFEEPTRDDDDDNIERIIITLSSTIFLKRKYFCNIFFSIGNSYGMIDEDGSNVEDNTVYFGFDLV